MIDIRKNPLAALLLSALLAAGCAATGRQAPELAADRPPAYQQFFAELDRTVDAYAVRDAADFPVPGFPYLRTNRFLWALEDDIDAGSQQDWIEAMRQLDLKARQKEISNLPDEALQQLAERLPVGPDRGQLLAETQLASAQLAAFDRQRPDYLSSVKASVEVAGEYSTAMRVFGLYPFAAPFVVNGTLKQYNVFKQWHRTPVDELAADGYLTTFAPAGRKNYPPRDVSGLFAPSRRNSLGIPDLTPAETRKLVLAYAPVIEQDVVGSFDLFGKLKWKAGKVKIGFDQPTVYYYITHTLLGGRPALQLNYAIWYSGRYGENAPRIERGPLDGVTFRITFDPDGAAIMVDIMNNCGCYYFYVPRKEKVADVYATSDGLYPFVPSWLPDEFPDRRLSLRINSGWHQVQKVFTRQKLPANALTYELRPYDELEALPHPVGNTESLFTAAGIMKDSSRIEPYIFFSMGIPKVGYMRQRGNHAVKLVGRAHFTDTDIYDQYFSFH